MPRFNFYPYSLYSLFAKKGDKQYLLKVLINLVFLQGAVWLFSFTSKMSDRIYAAINERVEICLHM